MYVIYTEHEIFVIIYKHNIFRISIKMLYLYSQNIKYLISTMYVSIFAKDALLTSSYFDVHFHLN